MALVTLIAKSSTIVNCETILAIKYSQQISTLLKFLKNELLFVQLVMFEQNK